MAEQAPSAGAALTLIRGRLKRCGSLRLHFEQDLIWGAGYDEKSPAEIVEWAAAQAELPVTQAAIERAARVVSQERWNTGATLQRALGTPRVLLRGGDGSRGQRAMLFTLLRLWLPLLFGLALLCVWSAWLAPLLAVATALCAAQLLSARRKLHDWRERVATLRAAREFEVF